MYQPNLIKRINWVRININYLYGYILVSLRSIQNYWAYIARDQDDSGFLVNS